MAYFAPFIDASGFHMPTYADIRDQLILKAKNIFGQDIYLEIDSQDYQWISATANMIYDSFQTSQIVYNSIGPGTAIGSALDTIVKINGIKRKKSTYSTCLVTLTGTANTNIRNGIVTDTSNINWTLPSSVLIGSDGTITVLATCQKEGPITVGIGSISQITTPTYGWLSVTNRDINILIGNTTEVDSQLRSRQAVGTALPSQAVLEGIRGAIASVLGISRFELYENDTNVIDARGLPPHSITAVVEGGVDMDIATAIINKKTPGAYTNGTTSVSIANTTGDPTIIRFYRPTYIDIVVTVNVKALSGYTTQITTDMITAISKYCNSLAIGNLLSVSSLWGSTLTANVDLTKPNFSIISLTAGKLGQSQGTTDIITTFNEVTRGNINNVVVNVV